jgi:hypothetical protein
MAPQQLQADLVKGCQAKMNWMLHVFKESMLPLLLPI